MAAEELCQALRDAPPTPGYKGHVPCFRSIVGNTFDQTCRTSRQLARTPYHDAVSSEEWSTPRGVRAAGRALLRGKGGRIDLQDLHTRAEREAGLAMLLSAREKVLPLMVEDTRALRKKKAQAVKVSYEPPEESKPAARINPAAMEPAGTPSISAKYEVMRQEEHRLQRIHALRVREVPCAIGR